jgi:hypothetical protein
MLKCIEGLSLPSRCTCGGACARAGGWEAARRRAAARTTHGTHDADWHPKKGVVCCAIAIAAVQHAQDADTGPR